MTVQHQYASADLFGSASPSRRARRADSRPTALDGLKVMVVEDEAVVSMMIEQMLEDFGCDVVEVASRLRPAIRAAEMTDADLVLLDMNLAGEPVDKIVQVLEHRGVPFVFATGYGRHDMRPAWRSYPVVAKPFRSDQLKASILEALRN